MIHHNKIKLIKKKKKYQHNQFYFNNQKAIKMKMKIKSL